MKNKWISIIYIVLFAALLVVPLATMDVVGGKVSETENRTLASFPVKIDGETGALSVDNTDLENWLNDNIGFRANFMEAYGQIKLKVFGLSSSDQVLKGRDGWFFYTADHNIEIATGDYPLTEEDIARIAANQQAISDYYQSIGKTYIFMLVPSKVGIYPEYLPMHDETVEQTVADILAAYLREHTTVIVYNAKDELLEAKAQGAGKMYHKTDSHWNDLGTYHAYLGLLDVMRENGLPVGDAITVEFEEGLFEGDFGDLLGHQNVVGLEDAPFSKWDHSFKIIKEGELYNAAQKVQADLNNKYDVGLFENAGGNGLTLAICGDSQLMAGRKLPVYLAEHFSRVINYRTGLVSTKVNTVSDPDVVIHACSERFLDTMVTIRKDIPILADLSDLPSDTRENFKIGYHGMFLDLVNGNKPAKKGVVERELLGSGTVKLVGWAADFAVNKPCSAVYMQVGDRLLKCEYGLARKSVSTYFENDDLLNTGFEVSFPASYLEEGVTELRFILVSSDGTYRYEDIVYTITD